MSPEQAGNLTLAELEALAKRLSEAANTIREAMALMQPQAPQAPQRPAQAATAPVVAPPIQLRTVAPPVPESSDHVDAFFEPAPHPLLNPDGTYGPKRSRKPPPLNPAHQLTQEEMGLRARTLQKLRQGDGRPAQESA